MTNMTNDAQIDADNAASLSAKGGNHQTPRSDLSDNSGVTDTGLGEFPGATVEAGRTGRTGGGDNLNIPPEEGGDPQTEGSQVSTFDNVPAGEDAASWQAKTQSGSINTSGQAREALRSVDAPRDGQPQLGKQ